MQPYPDAPNARDRTLAESITAGHRAITEAFEVLLELRSHLTGSSPLPNEAGAMASRGIVGDADNLASRIASLVGELRSLGLHIVSQHVEPISQEQRLNQYAMSAQNPYARLGQ